MINNQTLEHINPDAYLINVARGELVERPGHARVGIGPEQHLTWTGMALLRQRRVAVNRHAWQRRGKPPLVQSPHVPLSRHIGSPDGERFVPARPL